MYEYLIGVVSKITPTYIVCEAAGVGYLLHVANPYAWSSQIGSQTQIYVHQAVREDAQTLYGFRNETEKALFLRLIGVTGIGPKSALAIIAADDNDGLVAAIDKSDVKYLTKFPGVGNKTAGQLVLDLKGKLIESVDAPTTSSKNATLDEALEALQSLGYRASELKKVETKLEAEPEQTAEAYIKQALRMLIK